MLALLALAGCAVMPRQPDLQRLYATARENVRQPPVIIIPGMMGSRLGSDERGEIWIGSVWNILLSDYRQAVLEIDPETLEPDPGDVRATGITGNIAGRDFYKPIID
ncbi:MAG: hypothetical protein ACPGJE_09420, partial [Wenzhouxiangellaceae bacterium]